MKGKISDAEFKEIFDEYMFEALELLGPLDNFIFRLYQRHMDEEDKRAALYYMVFYNALGCLVGRYLSSCTRDERVAAELFDVFEGIFRSIGTMVTKSPQHLREKETVKVAVLELIRAHINDEIETCEVTPEGQITINLKGPLSLTEVLDKSTTH